ncbi:MAG: hypothetical protein H0U85_07960 [Gemmatimonadales bacterium]|nr:hypothetical protein [Gemmatimonadales bacterium]
MDLSATHLHLMLNHVPILGTFFVAILLGWGLIRRSRQITSLGLIFAVILALLTIPIYLTGEPTEVQQKHMTWFDRRRAHDHEEKAETALIAVLVTGAAALAAGWLRRGGRDGSRVLTGATLVLMLVSAGLFAVAGLEGGQIRHEELRSGVPAAITLEARGRD